MKAFSECGGGEEKNHGDTEGCHFARFPGLFEQWKRRRDKCIDCQGEYFEGD